MARNSSESDRYTVHPVQVGVNDHSGSWGVRDNDTHTIESRHLFRSDATARAEAKNEGKTR